MINHTRGHHTRVHIWGHIQLLLCNQQFEQLLARGVRYTKISGCGSRLKLSCPVPAPPYCQMPVAVGNCTACILSQCRLKLSRSTTDIPLGARRCPNSPWLLCAMAMAHLALDSSAVWKSLIAPSLVCLRNQAAAIKSVVLPMEGGPNEDRYRRGALM